MSVTTFFYAPPENFESETVRLPDDEAHHALRVLRLKTGDIIDVVDGIGGWHRVELTRAESGRAEGRITERKLGVGESAFDLRLGLGMIRNRSRLETAIEKAVELGVNEIILLDCQNSGGVRVDLERCLRVARAAMKQSLRCVLPQVTGPVSFEHFLSGAAAAKGFVCEATQGAKPLTAIFDEIVDGEECLVVIGPEGGLSDDEIHLSTDMGMRIVSLGKRRLRSETAAIVACSAVIMSAETRRR